MLEDHLNRLSASARYFESPCSASRVRGYLSRLLVDVDKKQAYKIRLTMNQLGRLTLTRSLLPPEPDMKRRICISPHLVDAGNVFFYHKTTRRDLYNSEFQRAWQEGYFEVLFFNNSGELTEGSRNNVFLKIGDNLYTPPLTSGVLAGVFRTHLLRRCSNIIEQTLHLDELKAADAIYLTNAVRGIRRVALKER